MPSFTVNIGELEHRLEGWRLECEGASCYGVPPLTKQPIASTEWPILSAAPAAYVLVTRVSAYYRDLPQHFEATWRPDGTTDGAVLVGHLTGLTRDEWIALGRGRELATDARKFLGQRGHPRGVIKGWPQAKFDLLVKQTSRAITERQGSPASQPDVRAAMELATGDKLSPRTFQRRVDGRWDELTR